MRLNGRRSKSPARGCVLSRIRSAMLLTTALGTRNLQQTTGPTGGTFFALPCGGNC